MNQTGEEVTLITYERALFGQAKTRKFLILTNERKKMSTKTTFKRIALVAVVALGLGGLWTVPANAAAGTATAIAISLTTEDDDADLAVGKYTSNPVRDANQISSFSVVAGSVISLEYTAIGGTITTDDELKLDMVGYGTLVAAEASAGALSGAEAVLSDFTSTLVPGSYTLRLTLAKAGTFATATDLVAEVTMVVTAGSDLDLGRSTAFMTGTTGGADASSTTNAVARTAVKTSGTHIAQVKVTLLKADGTADTRAHVVTADVSGVGYVTVNTTANTDPNGTTRSETDNAAASVRYAHIEADGTAGTGSITISVTHAVTGVKSTLGTFSYTTYGDVAKLEVSTTNFTVGKAGGDSTGQADASRTAADNLKGALDDTTSVPAFIVKATDSTGRVATAGAAPTIVSSNTAVVASGSCALDDGAVADESSSTNGVGFYNCAFVTSASSKSGEKATLTIRIVDPADATKFISTTLDVTVGGSVSTETIAFDKSSYSPGEAMIITRSAKDSSGNAVADGTAAPAVTFTKGITGSVAAGFYKGGAAATSATNPSIFAPVTGGEFKALATSGNTAGSALSATATVSDENASAATDAANEATDAANAATDAALAAADAADAATAAAQDASDAVAALSASVSKMISSLRAQITSLTNLVIKIQKKVRA
jgi:hypothetical protein